MTEREAWLHLAEGFSRRRHERLEDQTFDNGLCFAVEMLRRYNKISLEIQYLMSTKILYVVSLCGYLGSTFRAAPVFDKPEYLAPYTDEGDEIRVALCKKLAAELEG